MQHRIAVVKSAAASSTPTMTFDISDDSRQVIGVTSVDGLLFVLRRPSLQELLVYDAETFTLQRQRLKVPGLSDEASRGGLTSCATDNCIYVSDFANDTIHKVELSGNNYSLNWHVASQPLGLSVNAACNLLVACSNDLKIQEYTKSGSLVREICLRSNGFTSCPLHAIQLTGDRFVVSCCDRKTTVFDVIEVDSEGRTVVKSYTNKLQSTSCKKFSFPRHLAVDKNNEFILVADEFNNRIVILSRSSNSWARELDVTSVDGGLHRPSCLYFDEFFNRMFIGEFNGHRVLVIDNVF